MPATMRSIWVCPRYRLGLVGVWPLTPLVKLHKTSLLQARNRFVKIHMLTTLARDLARYFWLEERTNKKSETALAVAK